MTKGDILYGRKNSDAIHPIIFLRDRDSEFFIGAMVTSSDKYKENIPMKASHFKVYDAKGNKFEFQFSSTFVVRAKLIKRLEWLPFRKIGELSSFGIAFVESKIGLEPEQTWEQFTGS